MDMGVAGQGGDGVEVEAAVPPCQEGFTAEGIDGAFTAIDRQQRPVGIDRLQALDQLGRQGHQRRA
jgi:hypothetical protein